MLMAWVRCCGGSTDNKQYLYKDGIFNVGMDNPGGYYTVGGTNVAVLLSSNKFTCGPTGVNNNYSVIGTTQKVDFTNYSTLIVKCKGLTAQGVYGYGDVIITSTKETNTGANQLRTAQINDTVEHYVSLDVSALTEGYVAFTANGTKSMEVYEAYLI